MGYKKDVIKGVSWTGGLSISTKAIGFLETIILARILAPEQFGAYAIALLALGLLEVFTETGINLVLIQEKYVDKYISSAWVISIIRGIIIMLVLLLSAPFIASFFHSSQSLTLLYFISIAPLLRGFINPSVVKLQKELLFGKNFWYRFIILFIDTAVSLAITYITKNPIGMVIGFLIGIIIEVFLSYVIVKPWPKLEFNKAHILYIFHRGKWITGSAIFDYLFYNIDKIVVGRLLGAGALGVYQLAYSIAVIPLAEIGKVFFHVVAPVMVKVSEEKSRLKNMLFKSLYAVSLITIPITLILIFFPQIFVSILGEKWQSIVIILPILAMVGALRALTACFWAMFTGVKKQNYTTITTFINTIGLIITIVPLVMLFGILGASISALIGTVLSLPLLIFFVQKNLRAIRK